MKFTKLLLAGIGFIFATLLFVECQKEDLVTYDDAQYEMAVSQPTTAGNNLSFPVIWSDGFEKVLREPPVAGEPFLEGEWWYVWAEDPAEPTDPVYSCLPNINDPTKCQDGSTPGDGSSTVYIAYIQKDEFNVWQADNFSVTEPLKVDLIDWGDNLESIDWSIKSQVRTEIVLYENLSTPVIQYAMRQVSGWGTDEVHGLQTDQGGEPILGPGDQATVYSHNARLTIQKLNIDRDSIVPNSLTWVPNTGWTETDPNSDELINEPIFNMAVYEAGDGPGYYNAEINVKGKIMYGYTWNLKALNDGAGFYRITYSFDETGGVVPLNTYFDEFTEILIPIEEKSDDGDPRGGEAMIDIANNLTYMDIRILDKIGGGNGGGGNGGGNGGGGNGGGNGGGHDGGN